MSDEDQRPPTPPPVGSRESTPENDNRPDPIAEAGKECIKIVQKFRDKEITKTTATLNITGIISATPGITAESLSSALDTYFSMLDQAAFSEEIAAERGRARLRRREEDENFGAENGRGGRHYSRSRSYDRSRSRSQSPVHKRRKTIDESSMPWVATSFIEEATLRPELKKTLDLLREWSIDPKLVRSSIVNSALCPEFPYSEWTNIIIGKAVNLDQVFSAIYTTTSDNRQITKVGDLEITSESAGPATKTVKTHGDWASAWYKAQTAYEYVMPHRTHELRKYGEHIISYLTAAHPSRHPRIINYDKAVRTLVASRRDITLADRHEFYALQMAHLDGGFGSNQAPAFGVKVTEAKTKNKRRTEVCRRHNAGTCPGACGRLHACSICKDVSHVEADCPKSGDKN
jgi:hypothetical protein